MNSQFLLNDNRYLLKFFAAKSAKHTLIFIVPMLLGCLPFLFKNQYSYIDIISLTICGFLYWSLVEYVIHRWIFHFKSKSRTVNFILGSFHTYHHQNPKDLEVLTSGWLTACFGILFHGSVFFLLSGGSEKYTVGLIATTLIVYFIYEIVHYQVHMKIYQKGLFKYLQDFHLTHHVSPTKNFGQTTPIWDFVFGTLTENKDTRVNANMQRFIKDTRC